MAKFKRLGGWQRVRLRKHETAWHAEQELMSIPCVDTLKKLSAEAVSSNTALNSRPKTNKTNYPRTPLTSTLARFTTSYRVALSSGVVINWRGPPPLRWITVGRGCVREHRIGLEVETDSTGRCCPSNSALPHNLRRFCERQARCCQVITIGALFQHSLSFS